MCIHFDSDNIRKAGEILKLRGQGLHVAAKALELSQHYSFFGSSERAIGPEDWNHRYSEQELQRRTGKNVQVVLFNLGHVTDGDYFRYLAVEDQSAKLGRDKAIMKLFAGVDLDGFPTPAQLAELAQDEARVLQRA